MDLPTIYLWLWAPFCLLVLILMARVLEWSDRRQSAARKQRDEARAAALGVHPVGSLTELDARLAQRQAEFEARIDAKLDRILDAIEDKKA